MPRRVTLGMAVTVYNYILTNSSKYPIGSLGSWRGTGKLTEFACLLPAHRLLRTLASQNPQGVLKVVGPKDKPFRTGE